jgi:hypothetical protein
VRPEKTEKDIAAEREIGRKLEIFLTNLGYAVGANVYKINFAKAFGFTINQVQGWFGVNGKGMPASALYRISQEGQDIDALFKDGRVTIPLDKLKSLFPEDEPPPASKIRAAQALKSTEAFNDMLREQVNERSGTYSPSKKAEPKTAPKVQAPHAGPVRSRRAKKR